MIRFVAALVFVTLISAPAFAEEPVKPRVQRRAEKHSKQRSEAVKGKGRVLEIDTVVVQGRPGKPQAQVETSVQPFKFPVGTARYSESDRRFVRSNGDAGW